MKKFFSLVKRAPKRMTAAVVMLLAAIVIPATLFAYGPNRPTFTFENPAPYVTFDSITDNPSVGDERNFVRIKDASDANATYGENVNVTPGHTYDVMVYYHNNATSTLNASGKGIAKDVTLRMQMSANVAAGSSTEVTGFIDSSNANPTEVYDSASLTNTGSAGVDLGFVSGSAKVTSNGAVNGATLPDSVFTTGTYLGYDKLDGTLPGCNQYAGYVVFQVKATQPNFTVSKQVSTDGGKTWSTNAKATAGSTVLYLVEYKNTGTTQQNDVALSDSLPKGETYVKGSSQISNASTNSKLQAVPDGIATAGGLDIGNYAPTANAYLSYQAKIADSKTLTCGVNTLTNKVTAITGNGEKSASATVTVDNSNGESCKTTPPTCTKDCTTTPPPTTTPPTTPPTLPETGTTGTVASAIGLGAIALSISYYIISRRAVMGR